MRPFIVVALLCASAPVSVAQDLTDLTHDLGSGGDFRLRVGAALSLGKTRSPAAVGPLAKALDDPHPAVRAAAAAALGVLGEKSALAALRARLAHEDSISVKSQIKGSIDKLGGGSSGAGGADAASNTAAAKMILSLGQMKNLTGVRGTQLTDVFRGATRTHAAHLPGVELVSDYADGRKQAQSRKLPLLVIDGVVNRLAQGANGSRVTVSAHVEYVVRKAPEQALKGSVSGTAQAIDSSRILQDQTKVTELEDEALAGAVESAMRGAPIVLAEALR
jgi:hypothetical protein